MSEQAKPATVPNLVGQAVENVQQAHADDMSGASHAAAHGGAPAAGEAKPDASTTVDVEKDGKVHVETGSLTDAPKADAPKE